MSSTIFRSAGVPGTSPQPETPSAPKDTMTPVLESNVKAPFTDYEKTTGKPFVLEHYGLGTLVNRGDIYDSSVFTSEVENINSYINHQIEKGEVSNTVDGVKNELKRIEKLINVKPDARASMRIQLVAEYAAFLLKSEGIKRASFKYGLA